MKLVALAPIHSEIIAALHEDAFAESWTSQAFADLIDLPASFGFICSMDEVPVGFILCQGDAIEAEIIAIATAKDARRQGVAKNLLSSICKQTERLFLEVAKDNPGAMAFYNSAGFTEIGLRKKYYKRGDGLFVDAVVMELKTT